jgi:hypothetical protein
MGGFLLSSCSFEYNIDSETVRQVVFKQVDGESRTEVLVHGCIVQKPNLRRALPSV